MAEATKTPTKGVAKYYRHKKLNQFQAIMSNSPLGKILAKSPSWEELTREAYYQKQGMKVPLK